MTETLAKLKPQQDGSYKADDGRRAQREIAYLSGRWGGDWVLRDAEGRVIDTCTHLSDLMRRNNLRMGEAYE